MGLGEVGEQVGDAMGLGEMGVSRRWRWFRVLVAAGADGQLVGVFLPERSKANRRGAGGQVGTGTLVECLADGCRVQ
jgi:hypothetical protein